MKICVICSQEFTEYGNNPWPMYEDGKCCDKCDDLLVIPKRLQLAGYNEQDAAKIGEMLHRERSQRKSREAEGHCDHAPCICGQQEGGNDV